MTTASLRVLGRVLLTLALPLSANWAQAQGFDSGSTGADGAFNPTGTVTLTMPASGVFNFTTVNIPANATVRFIKNAANTPVVILAKGDVVIAGVIDVSGQGAPTVNSSSGNANSLGRGGPGGFDGGLGGNPGSSGPGGAGQGPGGGGGGDRIATACNGGWAQGGGGGGHSMAGSVGRCNGGVGSGAAGAGGGLYGSALMLPLIGGSGGGGGAGSSNSNSPGAGGGGGGGAILIASSTRISHTGFVVARGGSGGGYGCCPGATIGSNASGGGGAGGSIRLVAPAISGAGTFQVAGGDSEYPGSGGTGAPGRYRIDIVSSGNLAFLNTLPTLTITSVGGIAAPAVPTGAGDISFPANTASSQVVALATTGVPPGTTVELTVKPQLGVPTTSTSTPLVGTRESATATATIEVPLGVSTVTAVTSYTVTTAMGEALGVYAGNERVERVRLSSDLSGSAARATLITVSGKQFDVPAQVLTMAAVGG